MNLPQNDEANDLLQWLNVHSVSIADGIPVSLIQQKWLASRRDADALKAALEALFGDELVSLTPGLAQPHVRLSVKGYQALMLHNDRRRVAEQAEPPTPMAVTAPAAKAVTAAAPPVPTASVTAATAAAAAPVATPAPLRAAPVLEAAKTNTTQAFLLPGKAPTEIALRNQVLHIFRDLKLVAGQQLIAMTLTRYWQEMGLRGEHLRLGIDVLLRDRYLEATVKRYENYWLLTEDGHGFMSGPRTPANLLSLAAPLTKVGDGYSDEDLRKAARKLVQDVGSGTPLETLFARWRYGRDALLHGIDLLFKAGDVTLSDGLECEVSLTAQGASRKSGGFFGRS